MKKKYTRPLGAMLVLLGFLSLVALAPPPIAAAGNTVQIICQVFLQQAYSADYAECVAVRATAVALCEQQLAADELACASAPPCESTKVMKAQAQACRDDAAAGQRACARAIMPARERVCPTKP